MTTMMDFREAIACLNEYQNSLANICRMLKPSVAQGELGEALRKLDEKLHELLDAEIKDALTLSIIIWEKLGEIPEVVDFVDELADLLVALNQLKLRINEAREACAEYLRQTAASSVKAKKTESPTAIAIREFLRKERELGKEERKKYDREVGHEVGHKGPSHPGETSNARKGSEGCAAAETSAPGNEAGTEIRIEPFESASPSAEKPGEEFGTRAASMDGAESLLNWVADLDRTSLIAALAEEAEAAQLLVRSARQGTASQCAKHREAMDYVYRTNRILSFFWDGHIAPGMSEHERSLCRSFEEKMPVRGTS